MELGIGALHRFWLRDNGSLAIECDESMKVVVIGWLELDEGKETEDARPARMFNRYIVF